MDRLFDKSMHDIIDAVAALIVVIDEQGRIKYFNESCEELTGYSFEEVENRCVWDDDFLLRPEDIEPVKSTCHNLIKRELPSKRTNYWVNKRGQHKLISWSNAFFVDSDNEFFIVCTGVDISEYSANIERLSGRKAKLNAIFESTLDGIIITDVYGVIEEVNNAVSNIFGYEPLELIGQNFEILMSGEDSSNQSEHLQKYFDPSEKKVLKLGREVVGQRKDQSTFPLYLSVTEIFFDDSRAFVSVIHDLTDRNKYLEDLHQAQKMEALGQLTGGLAHDFNNLLTVMMGDMEMLHRYIHNPEGLTLLDDALMNVELGAQLIERLLAFGRRQSLSPRYLALNELLSSMNHMLARIIGDNIIIVKDFEEKLWPIRADSGLIENAVLNLILNARDAMPNGGNIILKTENYAKDSDPSCVADLTEDCYVKLTVRDTGAGIAPNVLERIYEPFFTTKSAGSGTGLGLSMVYGFVKQSGGSIIINSELGQGTAVEIYLPKAQNLTPEEIEYADSRGSETKSETDTHALVRGYGEIILYVEDDPKVRQINARRLMRMGYVVYTAKDGPSAIKMLEEKGYIDLLFTDVVMPGGMSGKELGDYVEQRRPDVKVILTTGYAEQMARDKDNRGHILKKPYSEEKLSQYIREVLDN